MPGFQVRMIVMEGGERFPLRPEVTPAAYQDKGPLPTREGRVDGYGA
jgi:hypothetical protein